jgi:signal transduction histidine kinase
MMPLLLHEMWVITRIVTRHDGTVAVASTEGQGSTFTITLPLHIEQE